MNKKDQNTQLVNLQILDILTYAIYQFPDMNFSDILRNLEIVSDLIDPNTKNVIGWKNEANLKSQILMERIGNYKKILEQWR